jgi:hypothetical protein
LCPHLVENGLEMRKLWPPKNKGGQEFKKKKVVEHYKGWFLNPYVVILLLGVKR